MELFLFRRSKKGAREQQERILSLLKKIAAKVKRHLKASLKVLSDVVAVHVNVSVCIDVKYFAEMDV
jgi:hypothetical protein